MSDIYTIISSPVGELLLGGDGDALSRLRFTGAGTRSPVVIDPAWQRRDDAFVEVRRQLDEYFQGERRSFDLELDLRGTVWERKVWGALQTIPYGETRSYGGLAAQLDAPTAARAVGLANGRNPVAVVVPCHRVIGADGTLTGFGGGLPRKRTLLDLEAGRGSLLPAI